MNARPLAPPTSALLALACALSLGACGGGDGGAGDAAFDAAPTPPDARAWPAGEVPASTVPEVGVRRDVLRVPGVAAPANPVTGDETPSGENVTQVVRYRVDVTPAADARAIVIAMPGFVEGAGGFEGLARSLVLRSATAGAPIEVWAIDRRANLLEDLRGLDAAEAAGDSTIADGYYFGGDTVGGQAFAGFVSDRDAGRVSEWGLATHVGDVHALIAHVPAAERRARVFLMGHSLGASFVELYAGWRFEDGIRGADELAGVILVDGLLAPTPIAEAEWHDGSRFGGLFQVTGLDDLRAIGGRLIALPLLGVELNVVGEIMALRALLAPDAIVEDPRRDRVLSLVIGLGADALPAMTNAGVLGIAFDDASCGLTFGAVSLGQATGGAMTTYHNVLSDVDLVHPTDLAATYDWIDAVDADPAEITPLARFAGALTHGRTNLTEWYFPTRLVLDILAVGGGDVAEGSWQAAAGLRVLDGDRIDAPVLAIATALFRGTDYDVLRTRLAPVGEGRPHAGATRAEPAGLTVLDLPEQTHVDPLLALDVPANPVPGAVEAFLDAHGAAGTIAAPALE